MTVGKPKTTRVKMHKDIPFDQFTRLNIVAHILNNLRTESDKFKILDVGGYNGKTQEFLSKDEVIVVDVVNAKIKNYVIASGLRLPFKDREFDFVISFDVLEHISASDREKFLLECIRTSRRGVIMCAPYFTKANQRAEESLNQFYKSVTGVDHRWLSEHIENGLPELTKLEVYAKRAGLFVGSAYSNDLFFWVLMQSALYTNEKYNIAAEKLINANSFFNHRLGLDWKIIQGNSYREILYCFRDEKDALKITNTITNSSHGDDVEFLIEATVKVINYFLSSIQRTETKYQIAEGRLKIAESEIKKLDKIRRGTEGILQDILTSKRWYYANRISNLKNKVINNLDRKK